MSIEYIRTAYGVPARRGGRVKFTGGDAETMGTITGARGHYLRIRLDGHKRAMSYHPTWEIEYLTPNVQSNRRCAASLRSVLLTAGLGVL